MKQFDEKELARQREGHRERLRSRFQKSGLDSLQDYELLEYLLFLLIPRKDVKPLAKTLLAHFGGVFEVLDAAPEKLLNFGLTPRIAADLNFLRQLTTYLRFEKVADRPFLETSDDAIRYLQSKIGNCKNETLIAVFLDPARQITGCFEYQGNVNSAAVSPRKLVEEALHFHASGVVLVHNHHSGSSRPSQGDVEFTRRIYNALDIFDIKLLDHLIVTRNTYRSLMK